MNTSFLMDVAKPTRYTGGEVNEVVKDESPELIHAAIAFPDGYEIAMSCLGLSILYSSMNSEPDIWAERVFMPMPDMCSIMAERKIPLFSLESKRPLNEFDIVGFSLQFELAYTNILHMLKMGGIPLRAENRTPGDPVIISGGPCACNPEPLAPFMDAVFIGDGEEGFTELSRVAAKFRNASREELWMELAKVEGTYVPALYDTTASASELVVVTGSKKDGIPFPVKKRLLPDIGEFPFPSKVIVPHHEVVHDRYSVEIARGCSSGCRFCQAGYIYRPTRDRTPSEVVKAVENGIRNTGFDEVTLLSLNTGEYEGISEVARRVSSDGSGSAKSVALPSMRVDAMSEELLASLEGSRKSGFTIAPEAGSQRLRDLINKKITQDDVIEASRVLFSGGWRLVKLYFMIGLPTETEEDIRAIADLAQTVLRTGRQSGCAHPRVTVSVSSFIPKPFTPFQWMPMKRRESLLKKQSLLRSLIKGPVTLKLHDVKAGMIEAAFSLGDRRLADVLERACELGCKFDGWTEFFDFELWEKAFGESKIDASSYFSREKEQDEPFPWEVVDVGVDRKFLWRELERARAGRTTAGCGPDTCFNCGTYNPGCVAGRFTGKSREIPAPTERYCPDISEAVWRIRFRKEGPAKFLGHLDMVDAIVRALRRCGVVLSYTGGFHPNPKVLFTAPLPLGVEGLAEWMEFTGKVQNSSNLIEQMNEALPSGLVLEKLIFAGQGVPKLSKLTEQIYRIELNQIDEESKSDILTRVDEFMRSDEWIITKTGKKKVKRVNLRERILSLEADETELTLRIASGGFMDFVALVCPDKSIRQLLGLKRVSMEFAS